MRTSFAFIGCSFLVLALGGVRPASARQQAPDTLVMQSTLEVIDIDTGERRAIYSRKAHFEAPNWSPDGSYFLFNQGGRIYRLPVDGGDPEPVDTGFAQRCNNDHGLTPDGKTLIISDSSEEGISLIYTLPAEGGMPSRVTEEGPSYWHGVSPDGRTLAYVGLRDGDYDLYAIPIEGGEETRLTTAEGLDDGPDYSADGRYLYFNSVRTGTMHIYRMPSQGGEVEQLTSDDWNDWFPHPSPDGRWIVFLSYEPGVEGHPPNKDVLLRIMPVDGGEPRTLARLFGGQGTINVPSWAPDGKRFAFVSYQILDE